METQLFVLLASILSGIMLDYPPFALLTFKYKFNKYYAFVCVVLIDILLMFPKIFWGGPSTLTIIISCSFPFVWCFLLFKDAWWKRILVPAGFTIFIMFPLEFFTMFFMNTFWGGDAFADIAAQNEIYLAAMVLNNILYFIVMIFVILLWKRYIDKQKSSYMHICWVVAFYQTVLFVLWLRLAENFTTRIMWIGLFLEAFGMIIDAVLFYFLSQMEERLRTEEELAALYKQRDFEKKFYQMSEEHLEKMRNMQDLFLEQIHELQEIVKNPDSAGQMQNFMEHSQYELGGSKQLVYSTNPVINALLGVKAAQAEKQDVAMKITCSHEDVIGIDDIDICSVLGNLLDNSLEACAKMESEKRRVTVSISEKAGYFLIKTTNPVPEVTSQNIKVGYTSKTDVDNHGLGLKLVERICEKYEGKFSVDMDNKMVGITAILKKKCG